MNNKFLYFIIGLIFILPYQGIAQVYNWAQGIGSTQESRMLSIETDPDGNSYIALHMEGTVTMGGTTHSSNDHALIIAKMDSSGNYLWSKMIEGTTDYIDISIDQVGNVFFTGNFSETSVSFDSIPLTSSTFDIYFLVKYDSLGNIQWLKSEEGLFYSIVSTDLDGNVNISLAFTGNKMIDGVSYTSSTVGTAPSLLLIQYDSNGAFQWVDQIDLTGAAGNSFLSAGIMVSDTAGNIYMAGNFSRGSLVQGTTTFPTSTDSADFFMFKYDKMGNYQWGQVAVTPGIEETSGIEIGPQGNIYVSGTLVDSTVIGGIPLSTGNAQRGSFLIKFDPQGSGIWGSVETGTGLVVSSGLTVNQSGEAFIIGQYEGVFTVGSTVLSNADNLFILKYDSSGNTVWAQNVQNTINPTFPKGISSGNNGDIYFATFIVSEVNFGSITVQTNGPNDYGCIARLDDIPPSSSPQDSVWPGDANYDLVANNLDLLTLGIGYGSTGPVRPNASINWVGQSAPDWSQNLASGVNYKHIDCNGDGIIDAQDTMAISLNYGLTHNKTDIVEEMGIPLSSTFLTDSALVGDTVDIAITLGNDTTPAGMVYGLAFTINLDTSLINPNSIKVSYDSSWFGNLGVDMLALHKNFPLDGQLDIAITGTDQINRIGYGEIARISIIMIDDITAKTYISEALVVDITNPYIIDNMEISQPIVVGKDSIVVFQEDTTNTTHILPELSSNIRIYPNPTSEQIHIHLQGVNGKGYKLSDLTGRVLLNRKKAFVRESVSLTGIPRGIYFMTINTDAGNITRKIVIE